MQWYAQDQLLPKLLGYYFVYFELRNDLKLFFGSDDLLLVGYTKFDIARDVDFQKSTSSYLITFTIGAMAW